MRIPVVMIFITALLGCSGESTMPPGFNDACYGGNFSKNLTGAKPLYSATLAVDRSSRPILRDLLSRVAGKNDLKVFDEGERFKNLDLFNIYLCSNKGAFALVDNRAAGDGKVRIDVFSYKDSWRPEPFIGDLRAALTSQWPHGLQERNLSDTTLRNSIL